jgi:hypothetical protein
MAAGRPASRPSFNFWRDNMLKFTKQFQGVPNGEIYPRTYEAGERCPPELEAGARSLGAVEADKEGGGGGRGSTAGGAGAGGRPDASRGRGALDAALADLPGTHTDADYVVSAMRRHFGDLFTAADEAKVRDLVKPSPGKPSEGLTVEELKAALAAKNIEVPNGTTLKADLAALLDEKA